MLLIIISFKEDSSYLNLRRTTSIYKSQNFLYDVSLPIDECRLSQNVVLRNNRLSVNFAKMPKDEVKRVRSLQVDAGNKITITRNASCPSTLPTTHSKMRWVFFFNFWTHKMFSYDSNDLVTSAKLMGCR